jgi:zinc transporter ZupT
VIVSTTGLVLHSISDGLALGASLFCKLIKCGVKDSVYIVSEKSNSAGNLGIIIFIAILLHKAPAAIGFGTYLNHN